MLDHLRNFRLPPNEFELISDAQPSLKRSKSMNKAIELKRIRLKRLKACNEQRSAEGFVIINPDVSHRLIDVSKEPVLEEPKEEAPELPSPSIQIQVKNEIIEDENEVDEELNDVIDNLREVQELIKSKDTSVATLKFSPRLMKSNDSKS